MIIPESFTDISDYPERTYFYANGDKLTFTNIVALRVTIDPISRGHSHRLILRAKGKHSGTGVYVPAGWLALEWPIKADATAASAFTR